MWGSEKSTGRREMAFAQGTVSGMTRKSGAHRKGEVFQEYGYVSRYYFDCGDYDCRGHGI